MGKLLDRLCKELELPMENIDKALDAMSEDEYIVLVQKVIAICAEMVKTIDIPCVLSSTNLGIKPECKEFEAAGASSLYQVALYALQTEMTLRFVIESRSGEQVKKVESDDEAVYLILDIEHSQVYAFGDHEEDCYLADTSEFSLVPRVLQRSGKEEVKKEITQAQEESPFTKLIKLFVSPKQISKYFRSINKAPARKPTKAGTMLIGWGNHLYGTHRGRSLPSQRNCHAYVHASLLHTCSSEAHARRVQFFQRKGLREMICEKNTRRALVI